MEYCGCCGRECAGEWCDDCVDHVGTVGPAWERTWVAQYDDECPHQVER